MCFKKKIKQPKIFKISDESIEFIKKYLLDECKITKKINDENLDDFLDVAFDWETLMVDEQGNDKTYDYPNKERNEMADKFVTEISGKWTSGKWTVDFDDLNRRLGLF